MAPVLEQLATQLAGKVKFVKAKIDDSTEAASSLGVMGLPTFVFFKNGQEVGRHVGTASPDAMKKKIEAVA
ncbi:MAG: thioredoxin family protein [Planctomycetes bacterium]|nr:thioredoxin family protein [Planctomycetota bacterium]